MAMPRVTCAQLNTADVAISAKVAAVQQVLQVFNTIPRGSSMLVIVLTRALQSCGVITVLGQLLAVVPSVDANKQDSR
jgi:hypothetical protein